MSYVTVLNGWLEACRCGRFGAGHTRTEHLALAESERRALAAEAERPRATAVGNAETFSGVAAYPERVERADARLRAAEEAGHEDSWHEDDE